MNRKMPHGKKRHTHHKHELASELKKEKRILDKELDEALEETFPASDATAKY
ncbi:MAG: hypothetical protein QM652_00675 [Legionella sp.]|uniref:hypothetical protein n=1 Tax=Legionella sp. TaxID=459 RepID=UPI0039E40903